MLRINGNKAILKTTPDFPVIEKFQINVKD